MYPCFFSSPSSVTHGSSYGTVFSVFIISYAFYAAAVKNEKSTNGISHFWVQLWNKCSQDWKWLSFNLTKSHRCYSCAYLVTVTGFHGQVFQSNNCFSHSNENDNIVEKTCYKSC